MAQVEKEADRERVDLDNITNSELSHLIDEWIHSKRDRMILKLRLIDGLTYSQTEDYLYKQENIQLSERQIKNIVSKAEAKLFRHI